MHQALAVTLSALLLTLVSAQDSRIQFKWKVDDYPNPYDYNSYTRCGRGNQSYVCDPNGILTKQKADEIDTLIVKIQRETRCTCRVCLDYGRGYQIRVAIMPWMERIFNDGNDTLDLLRDAKMYSYILAKRWGMGGECNESLLILYSRYDGVLFTLTFPHAREVLLDKYIKVITLSVKQFFQSESTVGDGLKELITRYGMVFDRRANEALVGNPKASEQRSSVNTVLPSVFLTFFLCLMALALAISV